MSELFDAFMVELNSDDRQWTNEQIAVFGSFFAEGLIVGRHLDDLNSDHLGEFFKERDDMLAERELGNE